MNPVPSIAAVLVASTVVALRLLDPPATSRRARALLATLGCSPGALRWLDLRGVLGAALAAALLSAGVVSAFAAAWRWPGEGPLSAAASLTATGLLLGWAWWSARRRAAPRGPRRHRPLGSRGGAPRPVAVAASPPTLRVVGALAELGPVVDLELFGEGGAAVIAVIGAQGSGKTLLLETLAGVGAQQPRLERVELDGRRLDGRRVPRQSAGLRTMADLLGDPREAVHVPAEARGVALCAAEPAPWPGRSVRGELLAGVRAGRRRGASKADIPGMVHALGLAEWLGKRADAVSFAVGWSTQLGRALLARPDVLLVDMPRGLDDFLQRRLVSHLRWVATARPQQRMVFVARSMADLDDLADGVVLLQEGRSHGPDGAWPLLGRALRGPLLEELRPESLLPASVDYLDEEGRWLRVLCGPHEVYLPFVRLSPGWRGRIGVPPQSVLVLTERLPGERLTNQLPGRVTALGDLRSRVLVEIDVRAGAPLRALVEPDTARGLRLDIGSEVVGAFEPSAVRWVGHQN